MERIAFHEIEASISALLAAEDECEDMTPEQQNEFNLALQLALEELADAEEAKADGIAWVLANLEAQAKAAGETAAAIMSRKRSLENKAQRIKEYTKAVFEAHGIQKIKGQSATLYLNKSQSVEITTPAEKLPRCYTKLSFAPDKKMIKKALQAGANIGGAEIKNNTSLAVRR